MIGILSLNDCRVTPVSYIARQVDAITPTRDSSAEPGAIPVAVKLGVSVKGHRHRPLIMSYQERLIFVVQAFFRAYELSLRGNSIERRYKYQTNDY